MGSRRCRGRCFNVTRSHPHRQRWWTTRSKTRSRVERQFRRPTGSPDMVLRRFRIWEEHLEHIIGSKKEPRCFSSKLKEEMYRADPTCAICWQRIQTMDDAALDHIHQYWMGGKTIPENARLTHRYCNWSRAKSNRVEIIHVPEKA